MITSVVVRASVACRLRSLMRDPALVTNPFASTNSSVIVPSEFERRGVVYLGVRARPYLVL